MTWLAAIVVALIGCGVIAMVVWMRREMPDVVSRPQLLFGVGAVALALVGLAVAMMLEVTA